MRPSASAVQTVCEFDFDLKTVISQVHIDLTSNAREKEEIHNNQCWSPTPEQLNETFKHNSFFVDPINESNKLLKPRGV